MRAAPLVLVPLLWIAAIIALYLHHRGAHLWAAGGTFAYLGTLVGLAAAVSCAVLGFLARSEREPEREREPEGEPGRAWLASLATALVPLPWLVGALGTASGFSMINAALLAVAPDQAAALSAAGYSEAMAPRMIGAGQAAGIALGLALALGLVWTTRDRARGEPTTLVGALVALTLALTAGGSMLRAAHMHELTGALVHVSPADRVSIVAHVGNSLSTGTLTAAVVALVGGVSAIVVLRPSPYATAASWTALGAAAGVLAIELVLDAKSSGLLLTAIGG